MKTFKPKLSDAEIKRLRERCKRLAKQKRAIDRALYAIESYASRENERAFNNGSHEARAYARKMDALRAASWLAQDS